MSSCGTKRMNMGGMTGMHKMPDGTMMKNSEHKMTGNEKWRQSTWLWSRSARLN
jgi:hypothetical protein